MDDMGQVSRFLKLANGLVALATTAILHLCRVGVIVFAQGQQQPTYAENPFDRIERHLEYNDKRLDEVQKSESALEGGAEVSLGIIGALSILGFIRTPTRRPEKEAH